MFAKKRNVQKFNTSIAYPGLLNSQRFCLRLQRLALRFFKQLRERKHTKASKYNPARGNVPSAKLVNTFRIVLQKPVPEH